MIIDPKLDLVLERTVDVSPELVGMAWTQPEHLKTWFTPAQDFPNLGCYLEIVPPRKLVWTDALEAGFRPSRQEPSLAFRFTAAVLLEPHGNGTKYTAIVMHQDEKSREKHDAMGFQAGWGKALEQLVEHVKKTRVQSSSIKV